MTNGLRNKNYVRFSSMLTCGQRLQRRGLSAGHRGRGCGERCEWVVSLIAASPVVFVSHVLLSTISFGDVGRYTGELVHFRFCPTHYQNHRIILLLIPPPVRRTTFPSIAANQVTKPTYHIQLAIISRDESDKSIESGDTEVWRAEGGKARNFGK